MTYRLALTLGASLLASTALAIGPEDLKGQQLTADEYAELVAAATAVNPPKTVKTT